MSREYWLVISGEVADPEKALQALLSAESFVDLPHADHHQGRTGQRFWAEGVTTLGGGENERAATAQIAAAIKREVPSVKEIQCRWVYIEDGGETYTVNPELRCETCPAVIPSGTRCDDHREEEGD